MADELADRIRAEIGDDPNIGEIKMFGGVCFTLNGNMLIVASGKGGLLVRVGQSGEPAALNVAGVERMVMRGREMKGYVTVPADDLGDTALKRWIALASAYVGSLPPKEAKPAKNSGGKTTARKQSA